jgi:hypothetical protein
MDPIGLRFVTDGCFITDACGALQAQFFFSGSRPGLLEADFEQANRLQKGSLLYSVAVFTQQERWWVTSVRWLRVGERKLVLG